MVIIEWKYLELKAPIWFSWFAVKIFFNEYIGNSGGWLSHIEDREKYDGGLLPVGRVLDGNLSITDGTKILRMTLIHPNPFNTNRIWSDKWEFGDLDSIYLTWSCVLLSQVENPL